MKERAERDPMKESPERFNHAVRVSCCDACNYPECGCQASAEILRKGIAAWETFLSGDGVSANPKEAGK